MRSTHRNFILRLFLSATFLLLGCGGGSSGQGSSPSTPYIYSNQYSLIFDGAFSQYLVVGQPASLDLNPQGSEFTISAWFKAASATSSGVIISKSAQLAANRQIQLSVAGAKTLEAFVGGAYKTGGPDIVTDGLWHHVALVNRNVAGTYMFQLYVDGVAAGTAGTSGAVLNAHDWLIGARRHADNTDVGFLMTGQIDEVAVWTGAQDVTQLAVQVTSPTLDLSKDSGAYVSSSSLISWWRMGDASGDSPSGIVYDISGANDATATNLSVGSKLTDTP